MARAPRNERLRHWLTRALSAALGVAAIGALVFVLDPAKVGHALEHFPLTLVPAIVLLYAGVFVLQGVRWHYLLRDAGAELRLWDSVLLNAAGQTITALVPLGDLTRAALAAKASNRDFGTLAATVTVQELTYNLCLILCALPVLLAVHLGVAVIVATLLGMVAIVLMLTVSPVFHVIHGVIVHIPLLNRLLPAIDELQEETVVLLHRPDALVLSVLDLARAAVTVTVFWMVIVGLAPGRLGWTEAGFVLAMSSIGGAISLLPGGVGANEASVAGLLIVFGLAGGAAGAAALIQRFLLSVMAVVLGFGAYLIVRRRFPNLGSMFQLVAQEQAVRKESA